MIKLHDSESELWKFKTRNEIYMTGESRQYNGRMGELKLTLSVLLISTVTGMWNMRKHFTAHNNYKKIRMINVSLSILSSWISNDLYSCVIYT